MMMTKEFEAWWNSIGACLASKSNLDLANAKKFAWEVWREGREKLHAELIHLQLQRKAG